MPTYSDKCVGASAAGWLVVLFLKGFLNVILGGSYKGSFKGIYKGSFKGIYKGSLQGSIRVL